MKLQRICTISIVAVGIAAAGTIQAQQRAGSTNGHAWEAGYTALESLNEGTGRLPARLIRPVSLTLHDVPLQRALFEIAEQAGLGLSYSEEFVKEGTVVSVDAQGMTAADALVAVLRHTEWTALVNAAGQVAVVRQEPPAEPQTGAISGRVTDAGSGPGVSGASVLVEGTDLGAVTGNTGRYRIADVPAGTYRVVVQQLGYAEAQKSVTVTDGGEATADFALDISALPMDEIVATGTAFETKVRTLPNPINVITAKEIEAKQASNITDLLRGEIPGVMALSNGQRDYQSSIYVRGNAGGGLEDVIKIYIDGVEVASSTLLSTIDPKSIERIEVVRGPQASTIYGSGASSGVLQIFTKKGMPGLARPQLELQASAGVVEGDYIPRDASRPLTQDYSLGASGGGESFSYHAGAGYVTMGEWVRGYDAKTLSFSGGLRAVHGPLTAELTALWLDRDYDFGNSPIFLRFPASACTPCGNPDYDLNRNHALSQNTMGLTLRYEATPKWQHTLVLGDDQNRFASYQPEPNYHTPADSFVQLFNQEHRRRSVRYHTAYEAEMGSWGTARFTGGVDYWSYDVQGSSASNLLNAYGTVQTSSMTSTSFYNNGWWNAGYFGMAELAFQDRYFVTLAARVEDNPQFEEYGRAVSPRVGASYVRDLGSAELKLRAQWGKGVRPPFDLAREGRVYSTNTLLPNPEIAPEEKAGWDAGVDLFWGNRVSLSLTRFDEEARDLINRVPVDLSGMPPLYQYQNIGVAGMEGWEAEGSVNLGAVTLEANYAYSDNVILEVDESVASNPNATNQVGDRTDYAPKHSGGGRVTAQVGRGSVSLDASVMAGWRYLDYFAYLSWLYEIEPFRGSLRDYYVDYPALWKWNFRAEQAVAEWLTVFLRVDNLSNEQSGDIWDFNVTPGRTTVVGLRTSF